VGSFGIPLKLYHLPYGTKVPPDLAAVVAAWQGLPEALRAGILAVVSNALRCR